MFIDPENDQLFCIDAPLSLGCKELAAIEVTLLLELVLNTSINAACRE